MGGSNLDTFETDYSPTITFSMERVLSICQHCSLPTCPSLVLQILYAFKPSHRFSPSKTPMFLWSIVLIGSSSLAVLHYVVEKEPPKTEQMPIVIAAFVMSVFWISTVAGELLNCLAALGSLLKLPPALLGLTVLALGNSVGDLVAYVAVAKAGQPAMAMAMAMAGCFVGPMFNMLFGLGCFAGPMFNMLFGLGTVLVIQTANVYREAYELHFHVSIVIAFVFLRLSSEPDGFSLSSNLVQVPGAKVLGILTCRSLHSFCNSEPDHCKVLTVTSDQIKGERELGSEKPSSYLVKGTSNADMVFI